MAYKDAERQRRYQRDYYMRNREQKLSVTNAARQRLRDLVNGYKLDLGCQRCGFNESPYALDAHHVGEKKFGINRGTSNKLSWEVIKDELSRCEILCKNCHAIEHAPSRLNTC